MPLSLSKCYRSFSRRFPGPLPPPLKSIMIHMDQAQLLYLLKALPVLSFGMQATDTMPLMSFEWTLLLKKYLLVAQGARLGTLQITATMAVRAPSSPCFRDAASLNR